LFAVSIGGSRHSEQALAGKRTARHSRHDLLRDKARGGRGRSPEFWEAMVGLQSGECSFTRNDVSTLTT
ncbi:hypothetical protein NGB36_30200, partial [Streptomyces sp. RB6PN25]